MPSTWSAREAAHCGRFLPVQPSDCEACTQRRSKGACSCTAAWSVRNTLQDVQEVAARTVQSTSDHSMCKQTFDTRNTRTVLLPRVVCMPFVIHLCLLLHAKLTMQHNRRFKFRTSRRNHPGHLHAPALHRHGHDKHPPVAGSLRNSHRMIPACAPEPLHRPQQGSETPSVHRDQLCGHTSSTKVLGSYTSHTCCHALLEFMNACPAERRTRVVVPVGRTSHKQPRIAAAVSCPGPHTAAKQLHITSSVFQHRVPVSPAASC